MPNLNAIESLLRRSRHLPLRVIVLTVCVLAAVIAVTTRQVRARIREQITGRDAAVLHAVMRTQLEDAVRDAAPDAVADPAWQLTAVLVTSRVKGVLGTRLFDAEGRFVESFPPAVREVDLGPADLAVLRELRPVSGFTDAADPGAEFYPADAGGSPALPFPLLKVCVPLHTTAAPRLQGAAQFLIEGQTLANELTRLDRHLLYQAVAAFMAASTLLGLVLDWAFRRLRRAQTLLAERTADLQRANEELARTARTAAVGAVTAHLIHGLKSPLAGLQSFVRALGTGESDRDAAEWQTAVASTRRMQSLISQVVGVLQEEDAGAAYEVPLPEVWAQLRPRVEPVMRETGVRLAIGGAEDRRLPNRAANLASLILINLIENALRATPAGGEVRVDCQPDGGGLRFEVRDGGPGFPEPFRADVFAPRRSTREGGSGIGLAISKRLANHLGAGLELHASSGAGCVFVLTLPAAVVGANSGLADPPGPR